MLMLPDQVQIFDQRCGEMCHAQIVKLTREVAKTQIDGHWWNIGGSSQARRDEGDHHWKWAKIVGQHRGDANVEVVGLQTDFGTIEGAVCYRLDGRSLIDSQLDAVYVDRLATAPHNRPWLYPEPHYRNVGNVLLFRAVCHSWLLGFKGRVVLVSLPSERTVGFYESHSFSRVSTNDDGTIEFELGPEAAERWLKNQGRLK